MKSNLTNSPIGTALRGLTVIGSALLVLLSGFAAHAQSNYNDGYNNNSYNRSGQAGQQYVEVFEGCDFRGKSRALTEGRYDDVRDLNLGNDSISAVRVPPGFELILFEDERQRGKSTVITSNVSCLNRAWDNQASSLQVRYSNQANNQYQGGGVVNQPTNNRGFNQTGQNLTAGIRYVAFGTSALEQGNDGLWRMRFNNGVPTTFTETSRNQQIIFLRNNAAAQTVQINLATRQIDFLTARSEPYSVRIDRAERSSPNARNAAQQNNNGVNQSRSRGVIDRCFSYRAYARGGEGGLRFTGHEGFHRLSSKAKTGRLCYDGKLKIELSKRNPGTEVVLEVQGQTFRFGRNETHDSLLNGWYRKQVVFRQP